MIATIKGYVTAFAATALIAAAVSACGGSGGGGPETGGQTMMPDDVDLSNVTLGFMAGADTLQIAAGQSAVHGDVEFTCTAGGRDCEVTVMVDADGGITAISTGGTVTAMNSDDYHNAVTPMNLDLAEVTLGFMAEAGTLQIAAGQSAVHGDVEFVCTAGGRDCEITVLVDANGEITATSTGGKVTAMNAPGYHQPLATEWRNNPTAEDLLDHWNDPEALANSLALSPVNQADIESRRALIMNLIDAAGSDPATSGTVLRNVDTDEIEIIGERDGITYGQWKGGSAGTLNIEFDWRFAESVGAATRARMERAGKSWSHRIMDKNRDREAPSGTMFVHEAGAFSRVRVERTLDEDVSTNGVLIFVLDQGANSGDYSSAYWYDPNYRPDVLDPWLASMLLSRRHHELTQLMAHEIGHALGIFPSLGGYTAYDNLVNRADHTFEGPQAVRANGGDPVPFQWWTSDLQPVAPGTPGATVDYSHPGDCDSIMSYCATAALEKPGELDFGFLADLGYDILDVDTASEPELYGYGAWGQYSAWGAGVERVLEYVDDGSEIAAHDQLRAGADAFGIAPSMDLVELHSSDSLGNATWTGSLIGVDLGSANLSPVFGDAELGVDLATLDGTAQFDNLTAYTDGEAVGFRSPDLTYDIEVTGNSFSDADGHLAGSFFGPSHEEMAGILNDRTPAVDLLAGFGGTR